MERLTSSRLKIGRAQHHIDDLKRELDVFSNDDDIYKIVVEPDSEGGQHIHKAVLVKPIPDAIPLIIGDAVCNLRSALDHIASAFPVDPSKRANYFPFFKDRDDFKRKEPGFPKNNIAPDIFACFCRFQPYQGGNDLLWGLNDIANRDKHEMIPIAVIGSANYALSRAVGRNEKFEQAVFYKRWDRVKNEIEFLRAPADADYNLGLGFKIILDRPQVLSGKPILAVLDRLRTEVDTILLAVEAEAIRVGYT